MDLPLISGISGIWSGESLLQNISQMSNSNQHQYKFIDHNFEKSASTIYMTLTCSLLKLNTMPLVTPGGNNCCLMANDVQN